MAYGPRRRAGAREGAVSKRNLEVLKVKDLKPYSKWFTITVKILKLNDEKTVFSRKDGAQHRVADAIVGDETGTVIMSVWDDDIDKIREIIGSTVRIRNGFTTLYRGSLRLTLSRFSTLERIEDEITEVNEKFNVSERAQLR
ncbi:MAG: hypothetical protein QW407_03080 [Thermofilaceae archaeon]